MTGDETEELAEHKAEDSSVASDTGTGSNQFIEWRTSPSPARYASRPTAQA
jgi:hypothetical protein